MSRRPIQAWNSAARGRNPGPRLTAGGTWRHLSFHSSVSFFVLCCITQVIAETTNTRREKRAARWMIASVTWRAYLVRAVLGYAASFHTRRSALHWMPTCVPVVRHAALLTMNGKVTLEQASAHLAVQATHTYPGGRRPTRRGMTLCKISILRGCAFQMVFLVTSTLCTSAA